MHISDRVTDTQRGVLGQKQDDRAAPRTTSVRDRLARANGPRAV
jgi:hypothetical protein